MNFEQLDAARLLITIVEKVPTVAPSVELHLSKGMPPFNVYAAVRAATSNPENSTVAQVEAEIGVWYAKWRKRHRMPKNTR